MTVMPLIINLLAFAALFLAVFAANALLVDLHSSERRRVKQRLEEGFLLRQRVRARSSAAMQDFSKIAADAAAECEESRTLRQRFEFVVEQSGLSITPSGLLMLTGWRSSP